MEALYSKITQTLEIQNDTLKNKETIKQLDGLKNLLIMEFQNKDIQRFLPLIQQNCLNQGAHRLVKLFSYYIIRNMSSCYDVDWNSIIGTIFSDFDSIDEELQKQALLTLSSIPLKESIDFITQYEESIHKYLDMSSEKLTSLYYCLTYLPQFLIKIYLQLTGDECLASQDIIRGIFIDFSAHLFNNNDLIALMAVRAFNLLFEEYVFENTTFMDITQQFIGLGKDRNIIRPLVFRVAQRISVTFEKLLGRINHWDHILSLDVLKTAFYLIKISCESQLQGSDNLNSRLEGLVKIYFDMLFNVLNNSFDLESNVPLFDCLGLFTLIHPKTRLPVFNIHEYIDQIWTALISRIYLLTQVVKWTPIHTKCLLRISSFLLLFPSAKQIVLCLKLISLANRLPTQSDRLFALTKCCRCLILNSLHRRERGLTSEKLRKSSGNSKGESPLFLLFYQSWFIHMWNIESNPEVSSDLQSGRIYREEIATMIIEAALLEKHRTQVDIQKSSAWINVAFEVADLCVKCLDWNTSWTSSDLNSNPEFMNNQKIWAKQSRNICAQTFITFLEELARCIDKLEHSSEAYKAFQNLIQSYFAEIAKRFLDPSWEVSIIRNQTTKISALLLLSKFWIPDDLQNNHSESLLQIIQIVKNKLLPKEVHSTRNNSSFALLFKNKPDLLLFTYYNFATRFEFAKSEILDILSDLETDFSEKSRCVTDESVGRKFDSLNECLALITGKILMFQDEAEFNFAEYSFVIEDNEENNDDYDVLFSETVSAILCFEKATQENFISEPILHKREHCEFERPLAALRFITPVKEEKQHYKFQAPTLISGFGDFLQIYINYSIEPINHILVFHIKLINITPFELKDMSLQISFSQNVQVLPLEKYKKTFVESLSTKETYIWNVKTKIRHFSECSCQISGSVDDENMEEAVTIQTKVFNISLHDLILPDHSCDHSETKFLMAFNKLSLCFTKQSYLRNVPAKFGPIFGNKSFALDMIQDLEDDHSEVNLQYNEKEYSYKFGLLGSTWFGNRIGIVISGIYSKILPRSNVHVEIRTNEFRTLQPIKLHYKKFIEELSNSCIGVL